MTSFNWSAGCQNIALPRAAKCLEPGLGGVFKIPPTLHSLTCNCQI